jgi:uncharacterized repeat protein (TIGR01451 family)
MKFLIATLAFAASTTAFAAGGMTLDNNVFVERVKTDPAGKRSVVLEAPKVVTPGDRLLFVLNYRNAGAQPVADFAVTNPIPEAVSFEAAEDKSAQVSIDGGKSWGKLAALKVKNADGTARPAVGGDVTHVRWSFSQKITAGQTGALNFRGVVK